MNLRTILASPGVQGFLACLIFVLILRGCSCQNAYNPRVKTVQGKAAPYVPKADSVQHPVIVVTGRAIPQAAPGSPSFEYIPIYIPGKAGAPDTVYLHDDTAQIIADYVARRHYSDTLRIDTAGLKGYISLSDDVQFNRLALRSWAYRVDLPPSFKPKPKRWGIGLQAGYGFSDGTGQPKHYIGIGLSRNLIRF